jgi:hypothetical protein
MGFVENDDEFPVARIQERRELVVSAIVRRDNGLQCSDHHVVGR